VTVAYPKLDSSNPLATSMNCCAASRIRLTERVLVLVNQPQIRRLVLRTEDEPEYSLDKLLFRFSSCL
jgi:hypothetical protein